MSNDFVRAAIDAEGAMPEATASEKADRIIGVGFEGCDAVIKMIIGHGVFDMRRKWRSLIEEKSRAAFDDIWSVERVTEKTCILRGRVGENFRDVNFIESVEVIPIGLERHEVTVCFMVAADFHAGEIGEAVILAPDKISVDDCNLIHRGDAFLFNRCRIQCKVFYR